MTYNPEVIELPLSYYVDKLKNKEPFVFSRFGDGEWLTILGEYHLKNSNGCSFTPELSKALRQVVREQNGYGKIILDDTSWTVGQDHLANQLAIEEENLHSHPYYQYALLRITRRRQGDKIVEYLAENNITMPWYNGDIILDESLQGNLFPLIEQLRERKILYVGNCRLRDLSMDKAGFFDYEWYVEPPPKNAFQNRETILKSVNSILGRTDIDFVGWSSGLAAKYFINEVYNEFPEITQIDFGSMFDGYFKPVDHIQKLGIRGRGAIRAASRSYIRCDLYDWSELLRLNTGKK